MSPNCCIAFSPLSRFQLQNAVSTCLKLSPRGTCSNGPHGTIGTWDVSRVIDMSRLFSGAKLFDADISKWDVSRVKDMNGMFLGASSFNGDLTKWDVSSVQDMSGMFGGAKVFKRTLCGAAWVNSKAKKTSMFAGSSGSIPQISCRGIASSHHREDGLRFGYDPHAPENIEKYGAPGETDSEGFDPHTDTVGPGIYGGIVSREDSGKIVIGEQYQNHNPKPGPVYAGGGYAKSIEALKSPEGLLRPLLSKFPELVNDVTTGGAQPLHMCGMSSEFQDAVSVLIELGGDIEALDTYGMTPLHRMASNNLAHGIKLLLNAGADPYFRGQIGKTPLQLAHESNAFDAVRVLDEQQNYVYPTDTLVHLQMIFSGSPLFGGKYVRKSPGIIPPGFRMMCELQDCLPQKAWQERNGMKSYWFKHADDNSYIHYNKQDRQWSIHDEDGKVVYIAKNAPPHAPPAHGWEAVSRASERVLPTLLIFRKIIDTKCSNEFAPKSGKELKAAVDSIIDKSGEEHKGSANSNADKPGKEHKITADWYTGGGGKGWGVDGGPGWATAN